MWNRRSVLAAYGAGVFVLVIEPNARKSGDAALDLRILKFLKNSPYAYGNRVAIGVKARKALVLGRLRVLAAQGLVDSVEESRGIKWFARRAS